MLKEKWLWFITTMLIFGLFDAHGCWEEERVALLHIKAYFSDPYYIGNDCFATWKEEDKGSDCCDGWDRVSCGSDGRVVTLSLFECTDRVQHLNASVFLPFQQLRELDLSGNEIVSWIEDQGSNMKLSLSLTKLETLDLGLNQLNSSILPHISGFQSLKRLWLGGNNLGKFVKLNDFVAFKNLKELDLSHNNIEGIIRYYNDVGNVSSPLRNLERLDLSSNMLNGSMDILSQLKGLHSLKYLSLTFNHISALDQPCDIETLRNLEELDLSYNYYFHGFTNCNGSAKWSSSLTNLKTLDLSVTSLNNSVVQHLNGFPSSLENLVLSNNQLSQQPYGLCQLEKLQTLDLSDNDYSDKMLPSCLGNLTALRALDLSYNQLAGSIPSWLSNLSTLRALDLSHNQLAGNIPSWLSNLSTLQQLNLSSNLFTENIAASVLANLTNLETLELSQNHFQIPSSFKSFANHTKLKRFIADLNEVILDSENQPSAPGLQLQVLSLSNCRLTSYPSFLHHQYNLLVLDLSNNFLNGSFPTWLVENTPSLKGLFLQNNSITGSFRLPASLRRTNMVALDISLNKIRGHIPEHMGDIFPQLQLLNMYSNKLEGEIPWSFGHMKSLWDLNLSNNSLIGTFPKSLLEGCLLLHNLIVSNNKLEGQIPSFSLQQELEILTLGNNLLKGSIPRGICSLHRLQYLDLSHNKLDGSIPSCFSNLSSLESIRLSNNKLRGQIIIPYYCLLMTLDLSNNKLYGGIPSQIANCTYLNALLLQGNMLDGKIPIQLCLLGYLSLLDLSHNNLSGSIPSCLGSVAFLQTSFGVYYTDTLQYSVVEAYVETENNHIDSFKELVNFTTKSMTYSYEMYSLDVLSGIDLSCNMLSGKIPHELGNLTNIQSINMSHNRLWGDIPKSFSNLTKIESLDLSYNNLSGRIPDELRALNFLGTFKVMHNNLSGKIPFGTQFLTFNESSYEGNPFLCGLPLSKKCALPPANANGFQQYQVVEDDSGWIDMEAFYVTFVVTGITMFLTVLVIFGINPHWRRAWFYLATNCATSSYYFVEDIIRKIRRMRRV